MRTSTGSPVQTSLASACCMATAAGQGTARADEHRHGRVTFALFERLASSVSSHGLRDQVPFSHQVCGRTISRPMPGGSSTSVSRNVTTPSGRGRSLTAATISMLPILARPEVMNISLSADEASSPRTRILGTSGDRRRAKQRMVAVVKDARHADRPGGRHVRSSRRDPMLHVAGHGTMPAPRGSLPAGRRQQLPRSTGIGVSPMRRPRPSGFQSTRLDEPAQEATPTNKFPSRAVRGGTAQRGESDDTGNLCVAVRVQVDAHGNAMSELNETRAVGRRPTPPVVRHPWRRRPVRRGPRKSAQTPSSHLPHRALGPASPPVALEMAAPIQARTRHRAAAAGNNHHDGARSPLSPTRPSARDAPIRSGAIPLRPPLVVVLDDGSGDPGAFVDRSRIGAVAQARHLGRPRAALDRRR